MSDQLAYALQNLKFFRDGAVEIEFVLSPDVKQNGLAMRRTLYVPAAKNWDDEIDAIYDAVSALVFDAMEDVTTSTPATLIADDDDEDGGLGE